MENEIGNNTEYEKKISVADRKVLKCRTEYQRHEANRIQLKDEVCQLKGLVCVFITTNYTNKHKGFPLLRTCLLVLFVTSLHVVKLELIGYTRASLVAQMVKHLPTIRETRVRSLGQKDPLEKEMATIHCSILAWKIPWTEEPGRLQSMGLQRVGHN